MLTEYFTSVTTSSTNAGFGAVQDEYLFIVQLSYEGLNHGWGLKPVIFHFPLACAWQAVGGSGAVGCPSMSSAVVFWRSQWDG